MSIVKLLLFSGKSESFPLPWKELGKNFQFFWKAESRKNPKNFNCNCLANAFGLGRNIHQAMLLKMDVAYDLLPKIIN